MTAETKSKLDSMLTIAGFAMALLLQTVTIVWWAQGVQKDVDKATEDNVAQTHRLDKIEEDTRSMAVGAATVSAQLQAVRDSLVDVKSGQAEILRLLTNKEVRQ